jgi:hypothetical protein
VLVHVLAIDAITLATRLHLALGGGAEWRWLHCHCLRYTYARICGAYERKDHRKITGRIIVIVTSKRKIKGHNWGCVILVVEMETEIGLIIITYSMLNQND